MKRFRDFLKEQQSFDDLDGIDQPIGLDYHDLDEIIEEDRKLIKEHYLNLFNQNDREKYKDEVWDVLEKSYENSGGLIGMEDADQLIRETDMWKLCKRNGKIVAAMCYSFKRGGRKTCYGGCDMTRQGKEDLYKIMKADMEQEHRQFWTEVSDAIEHIYVDKMHAPMIPAEVAQKLLRNKKFSKIDDDGYHYYRKIGDKVKRKLMVGIYKGKTEEED